MARTERAPADVDPEAVAGVLFALAPGFLVQRITLGENALDLGPYVDAIQALISQDRRSVN